MKKYLLSVWLVMVAGTLIACGGGGGSAGVAVDSNANGFTSAVLAMTSDKSDSTDPVDVNSVAAVTAPDNTDPVPII